jgi:hypothetical protein
VFPGAVGAMFYVAVVTSVCAGADAVAVWLCQKWAIWANLVIGLSSIVLVTRAWGSALVSDHHLVRDVRRPHLLAPATGTFSSIGSVLAL